MPRNTAPRKNARSRRGAGAASNARRFIPPAEGGLRVGIVAKIAAPETAETARGLAGWLRNRGASVTLEEKLAESIGGDGASVPLAAIGQDRDLVLVLGGDGTLLSAARAMGDHQVPIFGVNLGSLGFLTNAPIDQLYPGLEKILAGQGVVDERTTLRISLLREGEILLEEMSVNDVVITGSSIARVLEVRIKTAHGFVATVLGDGVIIATPTGSTAYNIGAGGPVVHPAVEAIVLAPIVPLTLTQRPVVFPDTEELTLTLRGRRRQVHVTFDGQASHPLLPGDALRVRKSEVRMQLLSLPETNYFRVLRKKLLWSALPPKRARAMVPEPPTDS